MRVFTFDWDGFDPCFGTGNISVSPDLLIYFADRAAMPDAHSFFRQAAPDAIILGCSSGGQFSRTSYSDAQLVGAAIKFDGTQVRSASQSISRTSDSRRTGNAIGQQLAADDLAAILLLSDGTIVNGSEVAAGVSEVVGRAVPLVGGLAGDGSEFKTTLVGLDDLLSAGLIAAVGLYGPNVRMGHGSGGGWSVMGPKRKITRSEGNVLYELDGKPALELYERYLGDEAADLPASALLFPLEVTAPGEDAAPVVRTILNIDREAGALIFAGNVPEGSVAQMMKTSFDSLIRGAGDAASTAAGAHPDGSLAFLVSCIGRRLMMGQRAEEEVESAGAALGEGMPHIGFYSYGEICPTTLGGLSQLHNQTMTVSVISEVSDHART